MVPDVHGNVVAIDGATRCWCGSKYWERDRCIDCGAVPYTDPYPDRPAVDADNLRARFAAVNDGVRNVEWLRDADTPFGEVWWAYDRTGRIVGTVVPTDRGRWFARVLGRPVTPNAGTTSLDFAKMLVGVHAPPVSD